MDEQSAYARARGLIRRAERGGPVELLDEAVQQLRELAGRADAGSSVNVDLGTALMLRHDRTGDLASLRDAVAAYRSAVDTAGPQAPQRPQIRSNLGIGLTRLYEATDDTEHIDEAVAVLRLAAAGRPQGVRGRSLTLSNLGLALTRWMERRRDLGPFAEAVGACEAAIAEERVRPATMAQILSNLGALWVFSFRETGDVAHLREAVAVLRRAVAVVPAGHPALPGCHAELGTALMELANATADRSLLLEAIGLLGKGLRHVRPDDPDRPLYLDKQALALRSSYAWYGDVAALREAVKSWREGIALVAAGRPEGLGYRSNLALALRNWFEYDGDLARLDEAVTLLRTVADETPLDHPERVNRQADLANALHRAGIRDGDPAVLSEAAELLRVAVQANPFPHPYHLLHLSNLGAVVFSRAQVKRDVGELDTAIGHFIRVRELSERLDVAFDGLNLADAYRTRFDWTGDPANLDAAAATYRAVASGLEEPARMRALAARRLGDLRAGRGDLAGALDGYADAISLLGLVAWLGLERDDQERLLAEFGGLAATAAACAIESGELDRAIGLLEQGRGVLFGQILDLRADLDEARTAEPELVGRLAVVHQQMEAPIGDLSRLERQRLATERESLLGRIRNRPQLSGFLVPPDPSALRARLGDRTVVIVNTAARRSDALIVSATGVTLVPLPGLTQADAADRAAELSQGAWEDLDAANAALTETLGWLWDVVVGPVAAAMDADTRHRPVWWLPTGPLSFLPLHAAGHYGSLPDPDRCALTVLTSSYTTTLRVLAEDRPTQAVFTAPAPLIVAVADMGGRNPLPSAVREAERVRTRLAPSAVARLDDATRQDVLDALDRTTWGHFACHAVTDRDHPSDSHLLLSDGPLRIRDVAARRGRRTAGGPALAYLSACQSARGARRLPDENLHVCSAFQLAGFSTVIGTLWSVPDRVAARAAEYAYARLSTHSSIAALNAATRELCRWYADRPTAWAGLLHIGDDHPPIDDGAGHSAR